VKAVILAAGKGTRLRPITDTMPKPLVRIGGRALLEYILLGLAGAGVRQAAVVTGYLAEQVEGYFGAGERVGMRLSYFRQREMTGTATAALLCEEFVGGEPFLMTWADILLYWQGYREVVGLFAAERPEMVLGLNWVEDPAAGAAVYLEGDRITDIIEKPAPGTSTTHWNNAGVMVLSPSIFPAARALAPSPRGEYELPQAVRHLLQAGARTLGVRFSGLWSDVGTPQELERLNVLAREGGLAGAFEPL